MTPFQKSVYRAVSRIPRGKVSTYAEIARAIGKPRAMRAVGNALNANPYLPRGRSATLRGAPHIPCHRVVRSDLTVGGFAQGTKTKILLLKKDGVMTKKGKISTISLFGQIRK